MQSFFKKNQEWQECAVSVAAFALYGKKNTSCIIHFLSSSPNCLFLVPEALFYRLKRFRPISCCNCPLMASSFFFFFFFRWFHIFFTYSLVLKVDRNGKPDRPEVQKKQTATREASITMLQSQYEVPSRQREFWGFAQAGIWHCSQTVVLAEWMSQKPMDEALNTFSLIFFSNSHL